MSYSNLYHFSIEFKLKSKRGIAIIVTCDYNGTRLEVPAINKDGDEMKKTFEELGYDIHQRRNENVTRDEIETLLEKFHDYLEKYDGKLTNEDGSKKAIVFAFSGRGGPDDKKDKDSMSLLMYDKDKLSLKGDIMPQLIGIRDVYEIPRLLLINASRGKETLDDESVGKLHVQDEGNYRIDYATIPDHEAYASSSESKWMPKLACQLRDESNKSKSFQNIAAIVKRSVHEQGGSAQQCESIDRLITGPLHLYPN